MGPTGPPPLRPFGLRLHHDGSWTHEGQPIWNRRLRAAFDRSVRYLPEEGCFVVQLAHFRGQIEVEEAPFFVRDFDAPSGEIGLSDGTHEVLDLDSLHVSPLDGAYLCLVKRLQRDAGVLARFQHAAHAEFQNAIDEGPDGPRVWFAGRLRRLPTVLLV